MGNERIAALEDALSRALAGDDPEVMVASIAKDLDSAVAHPTTDTAHFVAAAFHALTSIPAKDSPTLAGALYRITTYYFLAAQPRAGLEPAALAVDVARRLGDRGLLVRSLILKGTLFSELSDLPASYKAYAEALATSTEMGDRMTLCRTLNQLGLLMQQTGRVHEAQDAFERQLELAGKDPEFKLARDLALSNIALVSYHSNDVGRGLVAAREALDGAALPTNPDEAQRRVSLEYSLTRLLLRTNDIDGAKAHADLARSLADQSGMERAKLLSQMALGLAEIRASSADIGLTRLRHVVEVARKNVRSLLLEALSTLVAGYEMAGQPDVAIVYLHEMSELKRNARSEVILAPFVRTPRADEERHLSDQRASLRHKLAGRDVSNLARVLEEQAAAAELHDDATGEHCYRVGRMAYLLAKEVGVEDDVCVLIDLAARLHDIGKLSIPDAILLKPGKLTDAERALMQRHTVDGEAILRRHDQLPQMHIAQEIARCHHERWDGTGYPDGLSGTSIPISARIAALSDVFDALVHQRPYKRAWTVEEALAEIRNQRGRHFDPTLTDAFLVLVPRLQREHPNLDAYLGEEAKQVDFIKSVATIAAALKGNDPTRTLFDLRR